MKHDWRLGFQTRFASARILRYFIVAGIIERPCHIHRRAFDALAARLPLLAIALHLGSKEADCEGVDKDPTI